MAAKSSAASGWIWASSPRFMMAAASGCSLLASSETAACSSSCSVTPEAGMRSVTSGWPEVMVPVLSSATMRVRPVCSRLAAVLKRMPFFAPTPLPTMMATGVARPSAHGQLMTSTEMPRASAKGEFTPDQQPHDRRHDGDRDDRRDEHARDLVGRLGDRRLRRRRVGDHADDLAERGVLADAGGFAAQEAGAVDRRGRHAVAGRLVDRDALTGEGGFVDGARAVQHGAVDRDALPGADDKDIAPFDLRGGDLHLFAVADDGRRLRREGHEALERVGGLALGPCFEQFADGDERQDHGGGFKIEFVHIRHSRLAAAVQLRVRHGKQRVHAPPERGRRAERDERIHIRRAAQQALRAADEKFLVDDHDDPGQQQLDKAHGDVIAVKPARQWPAPHHVAHREIHQNEQEGHGRDEPLF